MQKPRRSFHVSMKSLYITPKTDWVPVKKLPRIVQRNERTEEQLRLLRGDNLVAFLDAFIIFTVWLFVS